ncbi:cilia- and flagella-associated protein 74 [Chanos chanos]|uniref:Cilia- and flagella-associated protein 74 n=1 Tax=Chanos chanos TaxID=29144 RepID=A0A6J2W6P1_CHACN|nr:cilia- and flagella-associated protein 74 [Chanos chanos]
MFMLGKNLHQLDSSYKQKELNVLIANAAMFRLQAVHKYVCLELQGREDLEAHISVVLKEHKFELCWAETELGRTHSPRQELEQEEQNFMARQEKESRRMQIEKNAIKRARQQAMRARMKQEEALQEQAKLHEKRLEQAMASKMKADVYLKQTLNKIYQKETEEEEKRKEVLKKRLDAAMSLKANIAANRETLRARLAREKAHAQKQREEEKGKLESLQAEGMYRMKLLYQQKKRDEIDKMKQKFDENHRNRWKGIVSKLLLEEERHKREESLLFPPVPSKSKKTLTSERSDVSSSLDEEEDTEEDLGLQETLAQSEFTGLWDQKPRAYTSTQDQETLPSILKLDKATLLSPAKKSVSGKEFKSQAFLSKPKVIHFKNFDVGKTYKKKAVLTNVTDATNYCQLLGVSENLADFVSIIFEPPGPVSPGLTCQLEAVFTPMINEDLDGEVQFQSATGPFSVVVKCSKKTCNMVVDSSFIDFGAHVVGQTISRTITLTNRGAMGTHYTLVPISSNPSQLQGISQHSSISSQVPADVSSAEICDLQNNAVPQESGGATHTLLSLSACATHVSVEADGAGSGPEVSLTEENNSKESCYPSEINIGEITEGEVGPFASVKIPVVFTPTIPGEAYLDLRILFSQSDCDPVVVNMRGEAVAALVWVSRPNIDLKVCLFDRPCGDLIEVHSRANRSLKLTFKVCKELKNHLEILPKSGHIQARSSFKAKLKFKPRCTLPEDAKNFFDKETCVLEVPLTIQVRDQVQPVRFTLHGIVTTSDLEFDCTKVDFGHCSIYGSVKRTVRLTNRCLLPQDFGFLHIPEFMDVQPGDGFGTILPQQTLEIDLIFSPPKAGEFKFQLNCKSGINRDFMLSCYGIGVHPPLVLSDSLVKFKATAVGDKCTVVLFVVNSHTSADEFSDSVPRIGNGPIAPVGPRLFSFVVPENSEISVSPTSGLVLPGKRCLVQVTFSPSLSDNVIRAEALRLKLKRKKELPNENHAQHKVKEKKRPSSNQASGKQRVKESSKVPETPRNVSPHKAPSPDDIHKDSDEYAAAKASLHRSFTRRFTSYAIPCFVSDVYTTNKGDTEEPTFSPYNTLHLELHCPAVTPSLVVTSDNGRTHVDFGRVLVGERVLKRVSVQNISEEPVELTSSVLDLSEVFLLVNALRPLSPGHTHTLVLAFTPAKGKKYRENLQLRCSKMNLELTLCGEGIEPIITCSHPGELMDFGFVLEKDICSQVFQLQNTCSLPVRFQVLLASLSPFKHSDPQQLPILYSIYTRSQRAVGTQNHSGMCVFSVSPVGGTIPPGKTQDLTVSFSPDHESTLYSDILTVELMNKQTVCVLDLKGTAWRNPMFVSGGDPLNTQTEFDTHHPLLMGTSSVKAHTEVEKLPIPVLVTLRSVCSEGLVCPAQRELEVGFIRTSQPVTKKNVEFYWENLSALQSKGFSVKPTKGSVDAGQTRTITVTWTPPRGLKPLEVVQSCAALTLKGEETEVYNVTLMALVSPHRR